MKLLEAQALYRQAFIQHSLFHSTFASSYQALFNSQESPEFAASLEHLLRRVSELAARQLSNVLLQYTDNAFEAIVLLAQVGANRLADFMIQHPAWLTGEMPSVEKLLLGLQQGSSSALLPTNAQGQVVNAGSIYQAQAWLSEPAFHVYQASREYVKAYLDSLSLNKSTDTSAKSFYQFIKAKYPNTELVVCSADLSDLDLSHGQFQSCDFSGAKIRLATHANFCHCQLIGADLQEANVTGCDFQGANLSLANAQGAQFKQVKLTDVNLTGADLSQAYLDVTHSEHAQWIGANLTEINTESLLIAEQLQQKQQQQTHQSVHQFKRQQQWWQALLPIIPNWVTALTKMKVLLPTKQHQEVLALLNTLNQTQMSLGLLRQQIKALKQANTVLKVESLKETLLQTQQYLKAVRAETNWENLLFSWQEVTKLLRTTETQTAGLDKIATLIAQSQDQLKAAQQTLLDISQNLILQQKSLQEVALKQWQAVRVRMTFDQALKHIDETISAPYRQARRMNGEEKPLSCFISYSWGDPVNERKVHRIAADLRQAGIGMLLDIWDNKPGTSVSRFTHETRNCDVVLLTGTLKLMEKWRIKMGVVSQEIPQIYGRLDQNPIRRVMGLQLNGDTLADVLPVEFLGRKAKLEQDDFVDLRQVYEPGIFQILRSLYQVQPHTNEALAIDTAERMFLLTARTIEQASLISQTQALGYEGENVEMQLALSLQAIARYEAEKQAQKRALENLLPTTLNKLYQAYEARQKHQGHRMKENAFGLQSKGLPLIEPLAYTVPEILQQAESSPVLLLKTTTETAASAYVLEKSLWRHYQADPEHQPIPILIDLKAVLNDCQGQLLDNYDTVQHILKQQLHYTDDEIQRLKADYRLVFVFTHYEALNTLSYAPYIDNHLELWRDAKAIVLCDRSFLANKNYQTVFSAGKQAAHLKLWEREVIGWMVEHEHQWQAHLSTQPKVRSARELVSDQTEKLREYVIQEQLIKALRAIKKQLGDKAPSLYLSYAPGEQEQTWQTIERLMLDLPQAGFKVLLDVRKPMSSPADNNNTMIPSSRYLSEMEQSDFILVAGSRWYLQQYEQKAPAIQEELAIMVKVEEASKGKSQGSKNFTSPIMPLLLERPIDPKARLETVLPPLTALRDSVCIDFKRLDQGYFDVLFDQLIPALYQASVYSERQSVISDAYQQFKQAYAEAETLDAEGLLQKVGYKQPTFTQAKQYIERQRLQQMTVKEQLKHLVPVRLQPLYVAHQQRVQQPELAQALSYYVPLDGQLQPTTQERFALTGYLNAFLQKNNISQVLLLLGESGSGKSLSIHWLEQELWHAYQANPQQAPIPILIELKAIEADVPLNFVDHYLQARLGYTLDSIRELKATQPVVFLFDGYDELPGQPRAVFIDNQLQAWQQEKVIVTGRPSVIQKLDRYQKYFTTPHSQLVRECYVSPFSQKQIDAYLAHCSNDTKNQRSGWHLARYQATLKSMPSLQDIMTSPLLLRMVVEVLPELQQQKNTQIAQNITRAEIYRLFIARWFAREDIRLLELGTRPKDFDAQAAFSEFAEKLAFHMFLKGIVEIHFDEASNTNNHSPEWSDYFRSDDPLVVQKRAGCPLKQVENRLSFYHKSFLEYFAALYVYKSLGLAASAETFETSLHMLTQQPINQKFMTNDPTGTGQAMLTLLAEIIDSNTVMNKRLLQVVKASCSQPVVAMAASNAITVLNYANYSFSGQDLAHIQVPGADLSEAQLESTNLSDADLSSARLDKAWLRQANLSEANLTGIRLGERPRSTYDYLGALAYDSTGRYRAIGTTDGVIVEDLVAGSCQKLHGHSNSVVSVAWSTQGELASGSRDNTVIIWDRETGNSRQTLKGHTDELNSIAWSPQGELASGSSDKTVIIWDLKTGNPRQTLKGHTDEVNSIAWSPQGELASGSDDKTVIIWNRESGNPQQTLKGHDGRLTSVAWSLQGELASGSSDKTVIIWNRETGTPRQTLRGHTDTAFCIAWSPQGELASGSYDKTVIIWNREAGIPHQTYKGHTSGVGILAWSPQGELVSGSRGDRTVITWDLETNNPRPVLSGHTKKVNCIAWSPQGELASGSDDKTVIIWDRETGNPLQTLKAHTDYVLCVAWSPQGELASGSFDKTVIIWNRETGTPRQTLVGHNMWLTSVAWSSQGELASASDKTVIIWNLKTSQPKVYLRGYLSSIVSLVWLEHNGQMFLAVCDELSTVKVWQRKPGHMDIWQLLWSNPKFPVLFAESCQLDNARGLKAEQIRLLKDQKSAVGNPYIREADWTDLHTVIANDKQNEVKRLLAQKVNLEVVTETGCTPLHLAAQYNRLAGAYLLIQAGANPQAKTKYGQLPAQVAENYQQPIAYYLRENIELWRYLAAYLDDVTARDFLKEMPEADLPEAAKACEALLTATDKDSSKKPLLWAAEKGYEIIIKALLEAKANVEEADNKGQTPLHYAAQMGHEGVMHLLLEAKANPEAINNKDNSLTALHYAAINGHEGVIKLLLRAKANIDVQGADGITPLQHAAINNHVLIMQTLVQEGANLNAKDKFGGTALHRSVAAGAKDTAIQWLLNQGLDINGCRADGCTPLHLAAFNGRREAVNFLLERGADLTLVSREGKTAAALAAEGGHTELAELIRQCESIQQAIPNTQTNTQEPSLAQFHGSFIANIGAQTNNNASLAKQSDQQEALDEQTAITASLQDNKSVSTSETPRVGPP